MTGDKRKGKGDVQECWGIYISGSVHVRLQHQSPPEVPSPLIKNTWNGERKITGRDGVNVRPTGRVYREWETVSRQIPEVEELTRDRRRGGESVVRERKTFEKKKRRVGAAEHFESKIELRNSLLKTEF